MKVVVTGAAGFIGRKLSVRLLSDGQLTGSSGKSETIDELILFDTVAPSGYDDSRVRAVQGDISDRATVDRLIGGDISSVFHLAAVVSAGAEADFDLGYRVNLDGTRWVLEACRAARRCPRVVFTSSIAVYGGEMPETIVDETVPTPQTSYGVQKLIGENLITDYTRKGFIDGRALRLPTITVRPGRPNRAASTWVSSMVREPLSGIDFVCPVRPDSPMPCLSPRRTVDAILRAHELPGEAFGAYRAMMLNGVTVTAGQIAEAVERNKGNRKVGQIIWQLDPATQAIVDGWPRALRSDKARRLGFAVDAGFDDIVRAFIADDLDAQIKGLH